MPGLPHPGRTALRPPASLKPCATSNEGVAQDASAGLSSCTHPNLFRALARPIRIRILEYNQETANLNATTKSRRHQGYDECPSFSVMNEPPHADAVIG